MFDVRDLFHDPEDLHTFPQSIGVLKTKWMSGFFLAVASIGLFNLELAINQLFGVLIIYILTVFMIYKSEPDKDDIFYTGWFDGVIGLHALALIAFSFWPYKNPAGAGLNIFFEKTYYPLKCFFSLIRAALPLRSRR